jgi:hypothetical protein
MTAVQSSGYGYSLCAPCCQSGCKSCPNGIAKCWSVDMTGNSLPFYNGTFCLTQSKANPCVFVDYCTNRYTLTVNGGATTLTSALGAVWTVSETFNCTATTPFGLSKGTNDGNTWQQSTTVVPTNCNVYPCYPNCEQGPLGCAGLCPNGFSQCWAFRVNGLLANGTCTNCAAYSWMSGSAAFWCLQFDPQSKTCTFIPSGSSVCNVCGAGNNQAVWTLTFNAAAQQWELMPDTGDGTFYAIAANQFNCSGLNTFTFSPSLFPQPACNGWPASITLDPIPCGIAQCQSCNPCNNCVYPSAWTTTLSGFDSTYSPPFPNGTWTLKPGGNGACQWGSKAASPDNIIVYTCFGCANGILTFTVSVLGDGLSAAPYAIYAIPISQVGCMAPATLALTSIYPVNEAQAIAFGSEWWWTAWPTSVTVSPAP